MHQGTDSTPEEGEAGALAVLACSPRPTALLCMSDRLAEGALRAARHLGLHVPADLSVMGFDDAVPTAEAFGLTTVHQPHRAKGEKAGAAILALLAGTHPTDQLLPTKLLVRATTGPAPTRS